LLTPPLIFTPGRFFDLTACFNKVYCVIVVFFYSGGYGEDIGVKNDVFRAESASSMRIL
jgi:hypothetical protein